MNVTLWILAGLLALASLAGGLLMVIQPKEKLAASGFAWVEDFSAGSVKALGTLKLLAAIGLILPAVLDIAPVLVPVAAAGWVLLMIGAMITHLRRHEPKALPTNLVLLAIAVVIVWGRFGPQSFS
jgi:DoxX-like protein